MMPEYGMEMKRYFQDCWWISMNLFTSTQPKSCNVDIILEGVKEVVKEAMNATKEYSK